MIRKLFQTLDRKEREFRRSFGHDITDPVERKRSYWHVRWLDHGILRVYWHNFAKVSEGVYRANQPDHKRFKVYADMGIKTILNLRGVAKQPYYLFEAESCERLGMALVTVQMSARSAPKTDQLMKLMDVFETMDRPFLMHCKSGADRTGLVAALYLMIVEGQPLAQARRQLSFRYLHIRRTATGILDHFLDVYEARNAKDPIAIADWIKGEYDAAELTESFAAKQAALRPWQGWR